MPRGYVPILELGRGGMGDVLLAVAAGPGGGDTLQVVKRLREGLASDAAFLAAFLDEARVATRLDHPNVARTYAVGFDGERHFTATEYLEGQSLEALFARGAEAIAPAIYLAIVSDALEGLHHAHELGDADGRPLGLVHRDVSPQSIFVTYEGRAKVLDFGLAKATESASATRTRAVKGKTAHAPLEQLERGPSFDRRADVFAAGAILWRIITGQRLWQGLGDPEIYLHLTEERSIPSPRTVRPDAPPGLVAICERALAFDPDDRYPTALALREAIDAYVEGEGLRATPSQVGRCVAELFAAERAELSAAIAARLAQGTPGEAPGGAAVPAAAVASSAGAPPEQGPSVASAGAAFGSAAFGSSAAAPGSAAFDASAAAPGSAAFDPSAAPGSVAIGASAAAPGEAAAPALSDEGAARALAALSSEDAANALAGRPAGGPLAWLRAWGAPAAAALVLAALVLAARSGSRLWGGAKVPEEYAPGELRAPPAGSLVLRVVAAPPNARVLVDGRPLQHGVVNFAQGEVRHRLSIEAPDHEPYADWVTLREARTTLRVTLQPTPTKGSAPAAEVVLEESPGG